VILAHNHPSGDPTPSQEDLSITQRLRDAGAALALPLADHLIIGAGTVVSLRERGLLLPVADYAMVPMVA
jgi:DNA repair protein RadC